MVTPELTSSKLFSEILFSIIRVIISTICGAVLVKRQVSIIMIL